VAPSDARELDRALPGRTGFPHGVGGQLEQYLTGEGVALRVERLEQLGQVSELHIIGDRDPSWQPGIGRGREGCGLSAMRGMLGFVGVLRAGVSLGLTGRYAVQSAEVRAGLDLWAADQPVELVVIDDQGSPSRATAAYQALLAEGIKILLGPYGSGTVRHVAPVVCGSGRLLWNHGGAADDLASPLLATVIAPASTYLVGLTVLARDAGLDHVVVAPGRGRFAEQVATGGRRAAESLGLRTREVEVDDVGALVEATALRGPVSLADAALVVAGTFEEDVAVVQRFREARVEVGLLGCVAAGIDEFGRRLGRLADGSWGRPSGGATTTPWTWDRPARSSSAASRRASAARLTTWPPRRPPRVTWPPRPRPGATLPTTSGGGTPTPCLARFAWTAPGSRQVMSRLRCNGAEAGECSRPSRGPERPRSSPG
jgi:ABC-type branched-subunit amino acid transport system substrate-binding protein